MKDLVKAEFRRIRTTRTVPGLLAGMLALIGVAAWGTTAAADTAELTRPLIGHEVFLVVLAVLPLFMLIVGIRSITDEFRHGSIVPALLAAPRRRAVLTAKLIAVGTTAVVFGLAAFAVAAGLTAALVTAEVGAVTVGWSQLGVFAAKLIGAAALYAAIGLGVGAIIRQQVAAIVGGLIWVLVAENLADGLMPAVAKYLPVHAANAFVGGMPGVYVDASLGAALLFGWATLAFAVGTQMLRRRDIA